MEIDPNYVPPTRSRPGGTRRSRPKRPETSVAARIATIPLPSIEEGAALKIVRPRLGGSLSLRTLMSGKSWTPTTSYVSAKNGGRMMPIEGPTALVAAKVDEVKTSTVAGFTECIRVELHSPTGVISTILDRVRQKDDGCYQLIEFKSDWSGFETEQAQQQVFLGQLAADALGAEYVREVPASLGSKTLRENCDIIQAYRFVRFPLRAQYVAADLLAKLGSISLGRLSESLSSHRANGHAMVCSMMVQRLVAIDLEMKIGRNSEVRAVPPLPAFMPGLFDALVSSTSSIPDAA